jgi:hypothetical protein
MREIQTGLPLAYWSQIWMARLAPHRYRPHPRLAVLQLADYWRSSGSDSGPNTCSVRVGYAVK